MSLHVLACSAATTKTQLKQTYLSTHLVGLEVNLK